jgi:hypothetical protein
MADSGQTYKNHTRTYPPFHFVVLPILLLNLVNAVRHVWQAPNQSNGFAALVAFGLFMLAFTARAMALRVQDRVIRMEQQLRMRGLLPSDLHGRIHELTPAQMVALRFAGDGELERGAGRQAGQPEGHQAGDQGLEGRLPAGVGNLVNPCNPCNPCNPWNLCNP